MTPTKRKGLFQAIVYYKNIELANLLKKNKQWRPDDRKCVQYRN